MKMTFVTAMVIFLKVLFYKYLITAIFKVLFQQPKGKSATEFEQNVATEDFTELILSWVNILKWKSTKVYEKLSVAQRHEPALRRRLHQNISLFTLCFFFSKPLKHQFHKMKLRKLPTNCLSVFDHFVGLALKGLNKSSF